MSRRCYLITVALSVLSTLGVLCVLLGLHCHQEAVEYRNRTMATILKMGDAWVIAKSEAENFREYVEWRERGLLYQGELGDFSAENFAVAATGTGCGLIGVVVGTSATALLTLRQKRKSSI